jgi:hypothetical protein
MADPVPTSITQTLPNPYLQGAYTALGERLLPLLSTSAGINYGSFMGDQFVAGQNQLQQQAAGLAGGLGSYQPYLNQAGQMGQQAQQTLGGAQQYAGPQAYQQFMSPYQQDVINTTLSQYDVQAQKGLNPLSSQAIGAGAFGGAREGIQRAEYQSASDMNRAQLQAGLQNQGFGQANQLANQAYQQQLALAQQQQGLGTFQGQLGQQSQQLAGNQIQGLNTLGQQQQQIEQAKLSAQQQALQSQAFEPYTRYGLVGQQLTGLAGGFPGQVQTYNPIQPVSPLQSFLGTATGLGGLAGKIFG